MLMVYREEDDNIIYEDDAWAIVKIETQEQAERYGKYSKWRFAGSSYSKDKRKQRWDEIASDGGDIYIVTKKAYGSSMFKDWCYINYPVDKSSNRDYIFFTYDGAAFRRDDIDEVSKYIPVKVFGNLPGMASHVNYVNDEDAIKGLEEVYNKDGWEIKKTTSDAIRDHYFEAIKCLHAEDKKNVDSIYIIKCENDLYEYYALNYSLNCDIYTSRGPRRVLIRRDLSQKNHYSIIHDNDDIIKTFKSILPEEVISHLPYINYWCNRYNELLKNNLKDQMFIYTKDIKYSDCVMIAPYINKIFISKDVRIIPSNFQARFFQRHAQSVIKEIEFEKESKCYKISFSAFYGLDCIEYIKIPRSVRIIEDFAFAYMRKLREIKFEEDSRLEFIGDRAFSKCTSLIEIQIPKTVKIMGSWIFLNDSSLRAIEFEAGSALSSASPECRDIGIIEDFYNGDYKFTEVKNCPLDINAIYKTHIRTQESVKEWNKKVAELCDKITKEERRA